MDASGLPAGEAKQNEGEGWRRSRRPKRDASSTVLAKEDLNLASGKPAAEPGATRFETLEPASFSSD